MAKQLDSLPEYQAKLGRTSHNLSHDFGFTSPAGLILPVFYDWMNPGETMKFSLDYFLRTQPLTTAAMVDIDVHTDIFFVPATMMLTSFDVLPYQTAEIYSSHYDASQAKLPLLNLGAWLYNISVTQAGTSNQYYRDHYYTCHGQVSLGAWMIRFLDHMGLSANVDEDDPDALFHGSFFPYQFLAYQACYQYYYRQDNRGTFSSRGFNIDRFYNQALFGASVTEGLPFFEGHCRPMYDDYFTSTKPSPILSFINTSINSDANIRQAQAWYNTGTGQSSIPRSPQIAAAPQNKPYTQTGAQTSIASAITTAQIRSMFANEKLWSITGRAKKDYDSQILAHFGFKVPHDVKHQLTHIGHQVTTIKIGEVISTSDTSSASGGSPLGEIAGKGYANQAGKSFKFTAPVHGCFIVLYSATPRYRYSGGSLKVGQISSIQDFYNPEYDHLGMQPLFQYEISGSVLGGSGVRGWQYRYEQYKRRFNRVTNAFDRSSGPLRDWMVTKNPSQLLLYEDGIYSNSLFVYPSDLNQVFLWDFDGEWHEDYKSNYASVYSTDHLIVDAHIKAYKVSTMSDYSLPKLID